jgi:Spy/CpxP family protein refolding chaperone
MLSRIHWKKSVVAGAMTVSVFVASTSPIFAAENFFQRAQRSLSSTMDGIVLSLPGKKSGKLVMKRMNESYKKLKSFESDTTVDVEILGGGQSVGKAQLKLAGPTVVGEVWNPQSYKQDMKVSGNLSFEGTTLSAAADLRQLDGVTYMRITQMPAIPGANFDQVKNQWIKFDPAAQSTGAYDNVLTAEQQQKMQDAFIKMLESSTVSEAKPEKKNNENVFVMTLTISKPALIEYIKTAAEINQEVMKSAADTPAEQDALAQQSPEKMTQELEKVLESVGEIKSTVWVERKNFFPTYFELPLEVDITKMTEGSMQGAAAPEVDRLKMSIVSDTSKFNESFTISAPDGAQDAETFFQSMMGPAMMAPGAGMAPSGSTRMMAPSAPTELRDLTPEQQRQLEELEMQYMMDLEGLDSF